MCRTQYFINYITNLHTICEDSVLDKNTDLNAVMRNIQRVESFDELDMVKVLRNRNKVLKEKLAKKYRHVSQLEKRIQQLEGMVLISQSGQSDSIPVGLDESESAPLSKQQVTAFADQDAGWQTTVSGGYDPTMDLANNADSSLAGFLQRPIRQSAQTWIVGQTLYYKFNPWAAFCENSYVKEKLKNFQLLRMKLHCKMVISGTKFHYGRALVSYNPWSGPDTVTVERDFIQQDLISASQKPHFFLNPTKNQGGELCLPFFYDKNYMSIPDGDWNDMGDIYVKSFGNLLHANGGDDPVTITIYLWAEDVVLTVPTISDPPILVSQSGRRPKKGLSQQNQANSIASDEYGQGIISKPAAAIAKAAGQLSSLPVIGPYMTATSIAAGAFGNIAKIFGYSRPNIVTDIQQVKPSPTGNLANTDAPDAAIKLTMDSKAELTLDSRTVGLDGTDQMGILDYITRESYLTSFDWDSSAVTDDLLWNTRVLPMQLDNINSEIHMTPLAHMASVFKYWQGSIKFRFQIVKSDFHKGRMLVRWDPNAFTSAVAYNVNYSRVVDIAETDDFEIVIGWGQAEPFKLCGEPYDTGSNFSAASRLLKDDTQANGILEVAVLNDLVSPSLDSSISVNVFVSACEDFKLAVPYNEVINDLHLWPVPVATTIDEFGVAISPQGNDDSQGTLGLPDDEDDQGENEVLNSQSGNPNTETGETTQSDKPTGSGELQTIGESAEQDDNTFLVYFGDPPTSIRELCKRYCFHRGWVPPKAGTDALRRSTLRNKNLPYYTGYDPAGIDTDATARPVTVGPTPYVSWFLPCYGGYRGGMRKKYFFTGNFQQSPSVSRSGYFGSGNATFYNAEQLLNVSTAVRQKFLSSRLGNSFGNGAAATNMGINDTIEVELPFYWDRRMASGRNKTANTLQCPSHLVTSTAVTTSTVGPADDTFGLFYQQSDAVAEDFSLFFYTGVPIYYKYALTESS
ncbi:hypothetical protein 2 [Beihai sipunculid worm virus 4]|uniref:hypothetical protein 2 n=1 Tax=Beihai sipunculid worm virus 4 TaxID=1922676 RepID=UPI00090B5511|nr:hypothetical protein 2 [Beihai sipunculid worm virus 4]APG76715.1 hypothetical protein 2 [Beihai sipunculid worm virus 4]APG76843.1 hypothetical protein 2 [Beihai sipunculid worm virus 4]APG78908.1 hypothetical protein 2 [Beihai sipunculid worm virus 4]